MSREEDEFKFFTNIRRFRARRGQNLEELAEESGVSLDMLEQLEQNILPEEMMVDDACRLAKALYYKIHELFD